jgi:hypothetical protein
MDIVQKVNSCTIKIFCKYVKGWAEEFVYNKWEHQNEDLARKKMIYYVNVIWKLFEHAYSDLNAKKSIKSITQSYVTIMKK